MMSRFFRNRVIDAVEKGGMSCRAAAIKAEGRWPQILRKRLRHRRRRTRWRTYQRRIDPARLVFIDETLYGWAPKGERLIDKVPHSHWETATFLAALR